MKTVSFYTLGCKVNTYDSTYMQEQFVKNGYSVVDFGEPSDIVVVNTCTVTGTADKKSRSIIRRAANFGRVIVAGCMAQKDAEKVLGMDGVSAVVGTDDRGRIAEIADGVLEGQTAIDLTHDIASCSFEKMSVSTSGERTRSVIKIQEGCNNFCSYCIIPYVRGRSRSKRLEDVIKEADTLVKNGTKEIVLTGIHIASYKDDDDNLADVVLALDSLGVRIRLGSIETGIMNVDFVKRLSKAENLCPHFHLSLQSGSKTVLARMNRKYTPDEYLDFLKLLRDSLDMPAITTDIITGFPGETEQEFKETYEFTRIAEFSRLHVFPFSARKGTKAYDMTPKISGSIAKQRAKELIALGDELELKFLNSLLGKSDEVLFEEPSKAFEELMEGYSTRYVRVAAKAEENECKNVVLGCIKDKVMRGDTI